MILSGEESFQWWSPLVWLACGGLLAWLGPPFVRRMRELARRLPSWDELAPDLASTR